MFTTLGMIFFTEAKVSWGVCFMHARKFDWLPVTQSIECVLLGKMDTEIEKRCEKLIYLYQSNLGTLFCKFASRQTGTTESIFSHRKFEDPIERFMSNLCHYNSTLRGHSEILGSPTSTEYNDADFELIHLLREVSVTICSYIKPEIKLNWEMVYENPFIWKIGLWVLCNPS